MQTSRTFRSLSVLVLFVIVLTSIPLGALTGTRPLAAQDAPDAPFLPEQSIPVFTTDLPAEMLSREAQLIAVVNESRRAAGVRPLRWNRELSDAARWFARDAVESQAGNCGHVDSLQRGPGTRMRAFGFSQMGKWGETIVCGFTEPRAVAAAWMADPFQRSLLLDPEMREAGAGFYYNTEKERGFIVLNLSVDPNFGPAVLNDEAVSTTSTAVTLSVYPQPVPAIAMKVSNFPTFEGVNWEPFVTERAWTLEAGSGWRWVYVLTRDAVGRTSLLSDVIYLGSAPDKGEISLDHATNIGVGFALSGLKPPGGARLRLSLGWLIDNIDPAFTIVQGPAMTVDDPQALGGSAMQMLGGGIDGALRTTTLDLSTDRILTAYVRLKSTVAGGSSRIGQISVRTGDEIVGVRTLNTGDFDAANQYQEFALDFAFGANSTTPIAQVEIERTGDEDLTVDVVRFFGRAVPVEQASQWSAGNSYYRSRGVVGRYETDEGVGEPFDVAFATVDSASIPAGAPVSLAPAPTEVKFRSEDGVLSATSATVFVCAPGCGGVQWTATTEASWLDLSVARDGLVVRPLTEDLPRGPYVGLVKLKPTSVPQGANVHAVSFYVKLTVNYPDPTPDPVDPPPDSKTDPFKYAFMPAVLRH